jgi:hypothetical protein
LQNVTATYTDAFSFALCGRACRDDQDVRQLQDQVLARCLGKLAVPVSPLAGIRQMPFVTDGLNPAGNRDAHRFTRCIVKELPVRNNWCLLFILCTLGKLGQIFVVVQLGLLAIDRIQVAAQIIPIGNLPSHSGRRRCPFGIPCRFHGKRNEFHQYS